MPSRLNKFTLRNAVVAISVGAGLVVVAFGCNGQTLDVGTVAARTNAGEGGGEDGSGQLKAGLTVDGVACTSTITGAGTPWPSWKIILQGNCGALGIVRGVIDSSATTSYPQQCGFATAIQWGMDNDGDAGTLYYAANESRGTCILQSGPSLIKPNEALNLAATVVHARNPSLTHAITYRGESTTIPVVLAPMDSSAPTHDAGKPNVSDADGDADGD